jgi:hypothetical protein
MCLKSMAIFLLIVAGTTNALATEKANLLNLKSYELPDGTLDLARLQQDYQKQRIGGPTKSKQSTSSNAFPVKSAALPAHPISAPPAPVTSLKFLLRKDFPDIGLFSAPVSNASADGAAFTWTRNDITHDTEWAANGTAAVAYSYFVEDIRSPLIGITVAPYVTLNRDIHSNTSSKNTDEKTFGVAGEFGWQGLFLPGKSDYLRGSVAAVQDDILGTTVGHGALEWLPVWIWDLTWGTIPGTFLNYNFTPEVEAQFDSTTAAGKTLLFSGQQQSLRVGPEAKLWFKVVAPTAALADVWDRLYGTVTYHWWTELYSGRTNSWLDAGLHYNLDNNGNVSIAFDYQRGRTEDTGAQTNLFKVTLTAKTCADVLGGQSC